MVTVDRYCLVWVGNGGGASKVSLRFLGESIRWGALLPVEIEVTRRALGYGVQSGGRVGRWNLFL